MQTQPLTFVSASPAPSFGRPSGAAASGGIPSPVFHDAGRPEAPALVRQDLETEGIAFLEGLEAEEDALALARSLGEIFPHRDSEPSGLTRILCRAAIAREPGFKGFSADALFPHTDQSCLEEPALFLLQVCREQAGTGGSAVLVDGRELYRDLARSFPELLGYLSGPRAAMFSDGRNSHCGAIFQAVEAGGIAVRFRYDSCGFFSPQLAPHIGYLLKLIEKHANRIDLHPGQAYIINNRWWLHGRESFLGEREMWRILLKAGTGPFAGARPGFPIPESRLAVA